MAIYLSYSPESTIEKALFNLDAFGMSNYRISGTVKVSVSDSFTRNQFLTSVYPLSADIYTSLSSGKGNWTTAQLANIDLITHTYSSFIDLRFSDVTDASGKTPVDVGSDSDINISFIYRPDWSYSGQSAGGVDSNFGYPNGRGDIVLNWYGFGSSGANNDRSLNSSSYGFHALMHEFGHSLGLAHPHRFIVNDVATLTTDFAATTTVGFATLGFKIETGADMNKEYFSIMSYDDQRVAGAADTFAQTPMILDVIALQGAYGAGTGTTGGSDDSIAPGGEGGVAAYRTYFDTGGIDTIDLANYTSGAYLHMGTSIEGALHPVGVSMSTNDENRMTVLHRDPSSLRWFYGEFENARGSAANDHVIGNALDNAIDGRGGDDRLEGGDGNDDISGGYGNDSLSGGVGNDTLNGGAGIDMALFAGNLANYTIIRAGDTLQVTDRSGSAGTDSLFGIERMVFSDVSLAVDMEIGQSGAQSALLIGAVRGRGSLQDTVLVGEALKYFDTGHTLQDASSVLLGNGIIDRLANGSSTAAFVNLIYDAVTGSAATPAETISLTTLIDNGTYSKAAFLAAAATSPANQANVGLVGLQQTGLAYS